MFASKEEKEQKQQLDNLVALQRGNGDGPEDVGAPFEGDSNEDD